MGNIENALIQELGSQEAPLFLDNLSKVDEQLDGIKQRCIQKLSDEITGKEKKFREACAKDINYRKTVSEKQVNGEELTDSEEPYNTEFEGDQERNRQRIRDVSAMGAIVTAAAGVSSGLIGMNFGDLTNTQATKALSTEVAAFLVGGAFLLLTIVCLFFLFKNTSRQDVSGCIPLLQTAVHAVGTMAGAAGIGYGLFNVLGQIQVESDVNSTMSKLGTHLQENLVLGIIALSVGSVILIGFVVCCCRRKNKNAVPAVVPLPLNS